MEPKVLYYNALKAEMGVYSVNSFLKLISCLNIKDTQDLRILLKDCCA